MPFLVLFDAFYGKSRINVPQLTPCNVVFS
jgi:hypothetical protein